MILDFRDVNKLSEVARRRAGMSLAELSRTSGVPVNETHGLRIRRHSSNP
jgi:hypothetical protein